MEPEEWALWRNNPTTVKFLKYLNDFRQQIAEEIAASIFEGNAVTKEVSDEAGIRCQIIRDIEEISLDDIVTFYKTEEEVTDGTISADEREAD